MDIHLSYVKYENENIEIANKKIQKKKSEKLQSYISMLKQFSYMCGIKKHMQNWHYQTFCSSKGCCTKWQDLNKKRIHLDKKY